MKSFLKVIWNLFTGLFSFAAILVVILLVWLQLLRRQADFTYAFTLLSLIAIAVLVLLIGYAVFANGFSRAIPISEFRKLKLNERVLTATSVVTAATVIIGIVFAAVRFDQARFIDRLSEAEVTEQVLLKVFAAEDFGATAAREVRASLGIEFDVAELNAAQVLDELIQQPEAMQFLDAINAGESCIYRQECAVAPVRQAICDATENLADFERGLPFERWEDDDAASWFRSVVEKSSRSAISHCSLPQVLALFWNYYFDS